MKKMKLGFFIGMAMMAFPLVSIAQSNTLGDRGPETVTEQRHKIQKQGISRKQKLLFRKPGVRHTTQYEYYQRVEQMAREKQAIARKQMKFNTTNLPHDAEYKFYKHAELVAKNKQLQLRKMAKPQYSDFSYFGHKRPPKRHLPYARLFLFRSQTSAQATPALCHEVLQGMWPEALIFSLLPFFKVYFLQPSRLTLLGWS